MKEIINQIIESMKNRKERNANEKKQKKMMKNKNEK